MKQQLLAASIGRIYAMARPIEPPQAGMWYQIKAIATEGDKPASVEVELYDDIGGWGIRAVDFLRDLRAVDDGKCKITVAINSLGGDVFDGLAIHNALRRLGDRCTARVDGVAASIASVIACGAHTVLMPENTMLMIHNPWTVTWGEADDLRATADMMDKVRGQLVLAYRSKAKDMDEAELVKMLDDTTWLTAQEAVALGLADVLGETANIQASAPRHAALARLKDVPQAWLDRLKVSAADVDPPAPAPTPAPTPPETPPTAAQLAARLSAACIKAGHPQLVEALIMSTELKDEATIAAEVVRVDAISQVCLAAKLPELAADYIKAGLSADAVRARLFDRLTNDAEIDNTAPEPQDPPADKPAAKAGPNATDIYAKRAAAPKRKANSTQGA